MLMKMQAFTKIFLKYHIVQLFLILIGIVLLVLGITQGEAREIFKKAIIVCMECIGIG